MKVGFLGMGVMGLPMAKNLVKKAGCEILGFDVVELAPRPDHIVSDFAAARLVYALMGLALSK